MNKQEEFYLKSHKFFENHLLKEIYKSEKLSICNLANSCYIIFDYDMCKKKGTPLGVMISQEYIKSIMQNNLAFYNWLATLSREDLRSRMVVCNDIAFGSMMKEKANTDINGAKVNLDYEEQLIKEFASISKR